MLLFCMNTYGCMARFVSLPRQGCVDGELYAALQRQAVSNDFNALFVLLGKDDIEVTFDPS